MQINGEEFLGDEEGKVGEGEEDEGNEGEESCSKQIIGCEKTEKTDAVGDPTRRLQRDTVSYTAHKQPRTKKTQGVNTTHRL